MGKSLEFSLVLENCFLLVSLQGLCSSQAERSGLGNGQLLTARFQGILEAGAALAFYCCGVGVMQGRNRFAGYIAPAELSPKLTRHYGIKQCMKPG